LAGQFIFGSSWKVFCPDLAYLLIFHPNFCTYSRDITQAAYEENEKFVISIDKSCQFFLNFLKYPGWTMHKSGNFGKKTTPTVSPIPWLDRCAG
jgi:hypothetical protein